MLYLSMDIKKSIRKWLLGTVDKSLSVGELRNVLTGNSLSIDTENFLESSKLDYYVGWVKVAVDLIAEKVASVKLIVRKGDKVLDEHPLLDLLSEPNAYTSQFEFLERVISYIEMLGNAPIYISTKSGNPIGLYFLDATKLEITKNSKNETTGYVYRDNAGRVKAKYKIDEVIPFHSFSPKSFWDGVSNIEANEYLASSMQQLQEWELRGFGTMMPPLAFIFDRNLTKEGIEAVKIQLRKKYSGSKNAFEPLILGSKARVEKIGLTPKDIDLTNLENMIRDKVLGIFRISKILIGLSTEVNRASAETALEVFLQHTITPKVRRIVDFLNRYLVKKYYSDVVLDFEPLVKNSKWKDIKDLNTAVGNRPIITQNEARAEVGFDSVKDGDSIKFNNLPIEPKKSKKSKDIVELREEIKELKAGLTETIRLDILSKKLDKTISKREDVFKKMYAEYAEEFITRTKENLKNITQLDVAGYIKKSLVSIDVEQSIIVSLLKAYANYLYKEKKQDVLDELSVEELLIPELDIDKMYLEAIEASSKQIASTLLKEVLITLNEGLKEGESMNKLVNRLLKIQKWTTYEQAETIARTETTYLENDMTLKMYRDLGVTSLTWIAVGDSRTRDSHRELHGQTVELGKYFETIRGNKLKYPGYKDAPTEEIINCRCRIIANI